MALFGKKYDESPEAMAHRLSLTDGTLTDIDTEDMLEDARKLDGA